MTPGGVIFHPSRRRRRRVDGPARAQDEIGHSALIDGPGGTFFPNSREMVNISPASKPSIRPAAMPPFVRTARCFPHLCATFYLPVPATKPPVRSRRTASRRRWFCCGPRRPNTLFFHGLSAVAPTTPRWSGTRFSDEATAALHAVLVSDPTLLHSGSRAAPCRPTQIINKLTVLSAAVALSVGLSACGGGSSTKTATPEEMCTAAGGTYADGECTTAAEMLAQRQADQRDAISDAIDAATTAVAAVDDDATDAEVSAANTAVAAARTAISGAADIPQAEKDANTGTVDALASRLSDAVTSARWRWMQRQRRRGWQRSTVPGRR